MTRKEFLDSVSEKYGELYDCSAATDKDIANNVNIPVKCLKHGLFWKTPYQLLNGLVCGCFECYKEKYWGEGLK